MQTLNCFSRKISTRNLNFRWQTYIVHKKELWRCNILLDCIRIESTDGNFGTHEKVVIHIAIVTCALLIHIFGIFVFPVPWDSHLYGTRLYRRICFKNSVIFPFLGPYSPTPSPIGVIGGMRLTPARKISPSAIGAADCDDLSARSRVRIRLPETSCALSCCPIDGTDRRTDGRTPCRYSRRSPLNAATSITFYIHKVTVT